MSTYNPNWGITTLKNKNDRKLFECVCRGQTGTIRKYLELGANINARDREDGTTPLMKACTRRNFVVQKLLLSCGADPNIRDLRGITALHIVAESGDIDSMKLLIAYQAVTDTADKFGCTPLHYASNRKQLEASDLLIFCGADAYEEDEWWRTPMTVCPDSDIVDALKESEKVLNGIKNKDIFIQTVELESSKTYRLENLDLTVAVPDTFKTNSLSFICRRVRPEYSHASLRPKGRELLISDTFEYRISTVQINGTVTLEIPLYDFPDPFEEVYMKTDTRPDIDVDEKLTEIHRVVNEANPSQLRWFCRATVDITKFSAFNLVTFPKVENFRVGQEGGKFSSKVDKFVHMSVEPDTFDEEGTLSLEVIPSPSYRDDVYKDIVSISHFYDITHNASLGYSLPVEMTLLLPLPQYYGGDGDLYLLSARMTSDFYVDGILADDNEILDSWEFLEKNPATRRGKIITQLPHLSIFVLVEMKKNLTPDEIKLQTDSLLQRASKRQTFVVFFSVLKPIGYDIYDLVVECTTPQKRLERVNYWLSKRYMDQSGETVKEFDAQPGKEFHITLTGNIKQYGFVDSYDVRLQFHPKRRNYLRLQVTMKNKNSITKGSICIREFDKETEKKVPVTNIDVHLTGEPFIEDIVPIKGFENRESPGFKGFTRDKFLRSLAHLIDDDWVKISLMLGLSYKTIDEIRVQCLQSTYEERTLKLLQHWRDMSMHRLDNYGIPDLMSALQKVDRSDLVDFVLDELHKWLLERQNDKDEFYYWVIETLQGPDIPSHREDALHPEPMSDIFFLLMIEASEERLESIGPHLRLSQAEMHSLFDDPMIPNHQHRLLRMLITAREKKENLSDAFKNLICSLEENKMTCTLEWVRTACKTWLQEYPENETPIRQTVEEYLVTKGDYTPETCQKDRQFEYESSETSISNREKERKDTTLTKNSGIGNASEQRQSNNLIYMRSSPENKEDYGISKRSKSGKGVRWEDPVVKTIFRDT